MHNINTAAPSLPHPLLVKTIEFLLPCCGLGLFLPIGTLILLLLGFLSLLPYTISVSIECTVFLSIIFYHILSFNSLLPSLTCRKRALYQFSISPQNCFFPDRENSFSPSYWFCQILQKMLNKFSQLVF